ncbi:hypothetical protein LTR09_009343 [Extremus antarcticus]|uniref:RING-type domain-containing protein n=1 Tax=Extremus antarcticus TaxID=702011 RepID=A0AAJ0D9A0_9PEZI|nr:hypothetical protein LTR09_009343 [Extremus antarcticus]
MATSFFWGGRSQRSTKSRRSHHSSRDPDRPKVRGEEAEADEQKPAKPDADEVRKKRLAYYSASPLERRRIVSTAAMRAKSMSSGSSKARGDAPSVKSERRKHTTSSTSPLSKATKEVTEERDRTADYVYGIRSSPLLEPIDEEAVRDDYKPRRSDRSSKYSSSSRRRSTATSLDEEVTPDDSISQIGSRSTTERRRSQAYTRPSLKRSSTTSVRLDRIAEESNNRRSSTSSKGPTQQESTLMDRVSRRHSTTSIPQTPRLVECLTCGSDDIPSIQSAKLACGHRMCHECLQRIFELSVKDPAHMPPRCCTDQHIPLDHVDKIFDTKFKTTWNRKYQEYHTKNRLYCPTPKCGHWIKPSHIHTSKGRKSATCPRCKIEAKKEGWQRCYSCKAMVERREGCNHMTCRCMAEFCIVCGSKWKSCECPWFNYSSMPNADRLNDMMIPEPIQVHVRRAFQAAGDAIPPPLPRARNRNGPLPEVTYQREMDERREQERQDAELARRLQLASLVEPLDGFRPRRRGDEEVRGLGNAARHFMNDDFVQNAANVVMNAFGDANLGRRGDRASGRRTRGRPAEQNEGEFGLANNFLGDESVLGAVPAARMSRDSR